MNRSAKRARPAVAATLFTALVTICAAEDLLSELKTKILDGDDNKHIRIVWARSIGGQFGFPPQGKRSDLVLVGYDSRTDRIDTLRDTQRNYQCPLLTRDGQQVVFSDLDDGKVYVVDWDGNEEPRAIADGIAGCLWMDPATNREYAVYAQFYDGLPERSRRACECEVHLVEIDDPTNDSLIYNEWGENGTVTGHFLSISADGGMLSYLADFPLLIAINLVNDSTYFSASGCWPTVPYDSSHRTLYFNQDHDGFFIWEKGQHLHNVETGRIEHPKFAAYSKDIVCVTTGMKAEGGSEGGNVALLKFNEDLSMVIDSIKITGRDGEVSTDGFPDACIYQHKDTVMVDDGSAIRTTRSRAPATANTTFRVDGRRVLLTHGRKGGAPVTARGVYITEIERADGTVERGRISVHP
ncbi:MAG: hypothetical protein GF344_05975 [Chitinivibrionales bacterium]|nr:hypothetical protein [Chitinivibrionales bacterium]MBD3356488.1 hypothetical protein [Chitinivibrionales bacterium]